MCVCLCVSVSVSVSVCSEGAPVAILKVQLHTCVCLKIFNISFDE